MKYLFFICLITLCIIKSSLCTSDCDVAKYLKALNFEKSVIPKLVCTAKYESSFNCSKTIIDKLGLHIGLYQIQAYWWCSGNEYSRFNLCNMTCESLYNCDMNAKCAKIIYHQFGLDYWYGYKSHYVTCNNYKLNC